MAGASWHRGVGVGLAIWVSALVAVSPAAATIPTGNLLANPGAEEGSAASDSLAFFPPPSWTLPPGRSQRVTAVRYGTPGFLTAAQGAAVGGGAAFFAGGPSAAGDDDSPPFGDAVIQQTISLPAQSLADVDAGGVRVTLSGCLGGYAGQDDQTTLAMITRTSGGINNSAITNVPGPRAAERGNQTELLPEAGTAAMPPNSRQVVVQLEFIRASGKDTYNDAYADNVAVQLSAAGGPTPSARCSPSPAGAAPLVGGGGPTSTSGPTDKTKPVLGGLRFFSTTFAAAKRGASTAKRHKAKVGTKVSFSLSEPSSVKFTVQRKTGGRKSGRTCVKATHSNRRKRACTRYVKVKGSFTIAGRTGKNTFKFRGRLNGKTLKPGHYRLTGQATDPARNTSLPQNRAFKIVK